MSGLSAPRLVLVDEHIIVVDKPAGLLCVPGRGADKQDCLSAHIQQQWPDALVVHRLDMATSGLVIMARGPAAQRQLSQAFAHQKVVKHYRAVVTGCPSVPQDSPDGWATIDLPIMPDWPRRPLSKVDTLHGKPSRTRWRLLAHDAATHTSALLLAPLSGRTHQLRLHLQAIGHPILGDALYAPHGVQALAPRLLLHASALCLPHPASAGWLHVKSPAPFETGTCAASGSSEQAPPLYK
jgi:tRNA pseudouridine32 synthase / 23S rRNA pseudouridine746 synthase